jgi:hexosaminidase
MQSSVPIDKHIVIDVWNNRWANPVELVRQGFNIVNVNDALLYIVPRAGYYQDYLNIRLLYENWEPYIFSLDNPALNLAPNDPHVLGGMFAEWNDRLGSVVSDTDVHQRVKPAMQVIAQKLWRGPADDESYEDFVLLTQTIGEAPGTHLPEADPLPVVIQSHSMP